MNILKIKIALLFAVLASGFVFAQQATTVPTQNELSSSSQIENSEIPLDFSEDLTSDENVLANSNRSTLQGVGIFLRMILVLAIVIAGIYFLFRFMKRSMGVEEAPVEDDVFLRKVSYLNLGNGKSVQIVSLWNVAFILGIADNSVTLLKEINDKELIDAMNRYADMNSKSKKPKTFEEILELFMPKKDKDKQESSSSNETVYNEETMNLINSLKNKSTLSEDSK